MDVIKHTPKQDGVIMNILASLPPQQAIKIPGINAFPRTFPG
jgi:hypothetical protein